MKYFFHKNRIAILIAAYAVLVIPAMVFSARYFLNKIADTSDAIQKSMIDDELDKKKVADIPVMEGISAEIRKNRDSTDVILDESEEVDFIKSLEDLAGQSGVDIKISVDDSASSASAKKQPVKSKDQPDEKSIADSLAHKKNVSLNISIDGNYQDMAGFVHKLENGRYYAEVVSIESRKKTDSSGAANGVQGGSIFIASPGTQGEDASGDRPETEKETLTTILKVIVYLR